MENETGKFEEHEPARPMVVVKDKNGKCWLCVKGVNTSESLEKQGCWQCGDEHFAFSRDD